MKNWAGNQTYSTDKTVAPQNLDELCDLVAQTQRIKPLGSRHSFNLLADCDGTFVSLQNFKQVNPVDPINETVTIGGGVTYSELSLALHQQGYALHNLASLPHISVAGAIATATHGSGVRNGNLATAVKSITLVTADGSTQRISGPDLAQRVVHLGALGIIAAITLQVEPAYEVEQWVYQDLPFDTFAADPKAIFAAGYSVSLFTNWIDRTFNQVWVKSLSGKPAPETLFGAAKSAVKLHPLPDLSPDSCTEQCGVTGPWYERLPHFRIEFTPSNGAELQSEYFIDADLAPAALSALTQLAETIAPALFVSELRYIAADNLLLSPARGKDAIGFHFTWKPDWPLVQPILLLIEAALAPFQARPHFGKLFVATDHLKTVYPGLDRFSHIVQATDPTGKFSNPFLQKILQ